MTLCKRRRYDPDEGYTDEPVETHRACIRRAAREIAEWADEMSGNPLVVPERIKKLAKFIKERVDEE